VGGFLVPDVPPAVDLMTITVPHGKPTLAEAAQRLGVQLSDMDATFGVVPIDPNQGLYAVQVRAGRAKTPEGRAYQGPWSNPSIAPFGPVQEGNKPDKDKN
jgi:hypothetical protein